jgi:hypothetical protein
VYRYRIPHNANKKPCTELCLQGLPGDTPWPESLQAPPPVHALPDGGQLGCESKCGTRTGKASLHGSYPRSTTRGTPGNGSTQACSGQRRPTSRRSVSGTTPQPRCKRVNAGDPRSCPSCKACCGEEYNPGRKSSSMQALAGLTASCRRIGGRAPGMGSFERGAAVPGNADAVDGLSA